VYEIAFTPTLVLPLEGEEMRKELILPSRGRNQDGLSLEGEEMRPGFAMTE